MNRVAAAIKDKTSVHSTRTHSYVLRSAQVGFSLLTIAFFHYTRFKRKRESESSENEEEIRTDRY